MTNRVRLAIVLLVAQGLAGCGASSVSSVPIGPSLLPAATSPPVTQPPQTVYGLANVTLSGVVSEILQDEQVPIEGVAVYCEPCGETSHTYAYTDKNGVYIFTGVWELGGSNSFAIWAGKEGYQDPPGMLRNTGSPNGPGWRDVKVSGDTRLDIQLARK